MEVTKFTGRANINLYRGDCNIAMAGMRAGQFGLAIVDPPYGIGLDGKNLIANKSDVANTAINSREHTWDKNPPSKEYFDLLLSKTTNQIIWGGNYFLDNLGYCKAPIIWDKLNGGSMYADGELAWTSRGLPKNLRIWKHQWCGAFKDSERKIKRQHPTQKPVALYKWLLTNYAKPGDTILDTHGGSMSIAIAAWDLEFDLDLYELDADYYKAGVERVRRHISQMQFDL